MPLTEKGKKIMKSMQKQYGKKKAEEVFYASKNAGKITGVDKNMKAKKGKIIKAKTGKFGLPGTGKDIDLDRFKIPEYEYERKKGSPEILIPKGPKKFERDADDPKRMERFKEERPTGRLPKSRRKEIEDYIKRTPPKDPEPPKQKIEFDEAKKGKMMSRKSGSPKKGENVMMKEKQKLFKEIDQAQKSLKPKKLKGGGAAIRGMNFKGVF